jgi:integrase
MARPRTPVGAYGSIAVRRRGDRVIAETRIRDADGRIRHVRVAARTAAQARQVLKERLLDRPTFGSTRLLTPQSGFADLAEVWLADLGIQRLAEGTKQTYRDQVRLHVLPEFEHYTLAEITTGRVEWFLKSQAAISSSRARQSRTLLNLLFGFALRHDAVSRNPVAGTSPLRHPKSQPKALTLEQIAAIRGAAADWRSEPGLPGPKPDGQVRDIIEVLLGTAMRTGEVLALRPCDLDDHPTGMVVAVTGTVVQHKGQGAIRQDRPKSEASIRWIPVPEFAASVLRRRCIGVNEARTIFANRRGGPLSPYNVRRTFRDFLVEAGLGDSGISLRWYRRTGATVIARAMGSDAAAAFLGHSSTAITEGHYIERDPTVDPSPAAYLERTLRPVRPDGAVLARAAAPGEAELLAAVDHEGDDDAVA